MAFLKLNKVWSKSQTKSDQTVIIIFDLGFDLNSLVPIFFQKYLSQENFFKCKSNRIWLRSTINWLNMKMIQSEIDSAKMTQLETIPIENYPLGSSQIRLTSSRRDLLHNLKSLLNLFKTYFYIYLDSI